MSSVVSISVLGTFSYNTISHHQTCSAELVLPQLEATTYAIISLAHLLKYALYFVVNGVIGISESESGVALGTKY